MSSVEGTSGGSTASLRSDEYGLNQEAAPEHNEPEAGLASPGRGRPRHARVTITVTNEGPFDGAEVVQLYIRDEYASVTRPVKELKAFKRIFLKNRESREITFDITPDMLKCFGADNRWSVEPGEFTIMIGSSSADEDLQCLTLNVE
ncbi:MAG: fibronectin type III-like domain-contianing protein [Bacteroidales bacterium]|nr:fibronectin type III-like domain-contianing protein [Bacteroidales bacterium]